MQPAELAQAAMTAALMTAVAIGSMVLPGAVIFGWLGAVPMGVLCYRHRLRAAGVAFAVSCLISFMIAGFGAAVAAVTAAYMGVITGQVKRRGRGAATMLIIAVVWGVAMAEICLGVFAALADMRAVVLNTVAANVGGFAALLHGVPVLGGAAAGLEAAVAGWSVHWGWFLGISVWCIVVFGTSFGWRVLSPVLRRLEAVTDLSPANLLPSIPDEGAPGPLPTVLTGAGYRYPGADRDALAPVTMRVDVGTHVAVTGANGSGKSTLMRILAGLAPTTGTVERPAGVGLGRVGGTALVFQHPESQVLGLRVRDDVVWGLAPDREIDVEGLLDEVGLGGMGDRDTTGLSGGELQRLAVASALAREPALLIADEVTTMVDQAGRQTLLKVLDGLTAHHRLGVVHITHYPSEANTADRVVAIAGGEREPTRAVPRVGLEAVSGRGPILDVQDVSFDYAAGTPWSTPVLRNVSFRVDSGDGILLYGANGSGKSTLAWIMAGLLEPSAGRCLLDGRPAAEQVGAVALCFQAARLQLHRGHAGAAVAALAGWAATDTEQILGALASVGLDSDIAGVLIDRLSGGQLRRIALAGLLARSPRLLILDEPLAGLDVDAQADLIDLLVGIRSQGQAMVVISHDTDSMLRLCPRTLRLDRGTLTPTEPGQQP
ncbi:ABC transporter ATP-binding protein [[Mycobacterium] holstebronense]|uniref:ATP-binding cassette domain-containing protein n=1 Tax=[Mycobacterium] holstebronense TaxID=3064288 RepID=A0ABN9MZZ5_9MYCO|nr:ATP-binding cassette domain-containing protein [Mycolicibacter sp. MU0102]CAJ1497614.1 ATP-binding cassette domain-containing protein [Mycolicibacter sp. MU0102]